MSDIKNYKCLNCANSVVFDPVSGEFKCNYCNSHFSEAEVSKSVVETSAQNKQDSNDFSQSSKGVDSSLLREYRCNNCGSEMITDNTTISSFCVYCKSPIVLAEKLKGEFMPSKMIPFKITQKQAEDLYFAWIKKKYLAPKSFKNLKTVSEIRGVYTPYWLFDAKLSGVIKGTATKVETWYDSDYDYTETSYYDVERGGDIGYQRIPVQSSTKLENKLMSGIEPYEYNDMKDFNMAYLSGFLTERYDIDRDESEIKAINRMENNFEWRLRGAVDGYSSFDVDSKEFTSSDKKAENVMMPVYYLANKYKGEMQVFMINGQSGKIYGVAPVDKLKYAQLSISVFFAVNLVLGIILSLFN